MIDVLSIVLTHGLIMLLAWRLLARDDLDTDPESAIADECADAGSSADKRPWLVNQKYLRQSDGCKRDA